MEAGAYKVCNTQTKDTQHEDTKEICCLKSASYITKATYNMSVCICI